LTRLLPGELHGDPRDRLIVTSARHLGVPIVVANSILAKREMPEKLVLCTTASRFTFTT
jgi:PIN domain nuclease of toxin-antitoxin system